jgi:pilus assembly protein CpaF
VFGKRSTSGLEAPRPSPASAGPATAPAPAASADFADDAGRGAALSAGLRAAVASPPLAPTARMAGPPVPPLPVAESRRSDTYYEVKGTIFGALIEAIDLSQLARLDADSAREEIRDIVNEIIAIKNIVMSISEQEELLDDICNDVLGYGPLEPLLARDDIADIMVNGASTVFIEVGGKIQKTGIRFRDNQQLLNICQRIVSQIGCPTARASTPSCRRSRSTGRRSPSASSSATSSPSSS